MAQLNLQAVDAFRVTLAPLAGGKNKKLIIQGDVPPIGSEVTIREKRYRIVKMEAERVIAVIRKP